ncbi:MAG: hypothetical protein H7293_17670 [Candidatus Saccharibacteria bacterium]|nr:hypothetical protein [Rhodoferax sp.]
MKDASDLSRTQIYLTQQQQQRLAQVSRGSALTKSALIRQAVDLFLAQQSKDSPSNKTRHLQAIVGLWQQNGDMKNPAAAVQKMRQPRYPSITPCAQRR